MHRLKVFLRALAVLGALPLAWGLHGCAFVPSGKPYTAGSYDGGLRCDIVLSRRCATESDVRVGIDVSRPFEDGFWLGRSSRIGLDKSPEAVAQCGERGQAIVFRCPFPDGCRVCVNCSTIALPGSYYPDAHHACVDYCLSQKWGNATECTERSLASSGSFRSCFPGACTAGGCDPDWVDPRRVVPTATATPYPTPTLHTDVVTSVFAPAAEPGAGNTVVHPTGDMRIRLSVPLARDVDITPDIMRGRLELAPAEGLPVAGGRYFMLTMMVLRFADFRVDRWVIDAQNFREVTVDLREAVGFVAVPVRPGVYRFSIPRTQITFTGSAIVNGRRRSGVDRPNAPVTGTIDLNAGTIRARAAVPKRFGCDWAWPCSVAGTVTVSLSGVLGK